MIAPWLGIGLVAAVLIAMLFTLRAWQRARSPHPETVRKLLHTGMGLVTLSFPWIFTQAWPVVVLGVGAVGLLFAARHVAGLRAGVGEVMHAVDRRSGGEIYFPIAVSLVFVLAEGDLILYCVPVLMLTVSDACAALVGVRYGRARYATWDGHKSVEGSFAFFFSAFLSVHVPLLLFTQTGRTETLLIALILGLLVMLLEAVAWRGLDNLFIPLGAYLLLRIYLDMHEGPLIAKLIAIVLLLIFVLTFRRRTTLDDSSVLAAALVGYVTWTIGGMEWLTPPIVVFVAAAVLASTMPDRKLKHDLYALAAVAVPGLVWLFAAFALDRSDWIYVYAIAYAAQLGIIALASFDHLASTKGTLIAIGTAIAIGWTVVFAPLAVMGVWATIRPTYALLVGVWVAVAVLGFKAIRPRLMSAEAEHRYWFFQGLTAGSVSLLALATSEYLLAAS